MKKLKLNLDEIKVESFETVQSSQNIGTVLGNMKVTVTDGPGLNTCNQSGCAGSGNATGLAFSCGPQSCAPQYSCGATLCGEYTCQVGCTDPYYC